MRKSWLFFLIFLCLMPDLIAQPKPYLLEKGLADAECMTWVDKTMAQLSLKEKVGQLFVYTIAPLQNQKNLALLQKMVSEYKVGGLLFSGGNMHTQALLTNEAQRRAKVPLLITFDGEWGLAMRLKNTPRFPRNMTLGCVQDNHLIYAYGQEVARQCREMGIHVNFAPVADVNINPDNPVINTRSFGEDAEQVAQKVIAYAQGLEEGGVLSVSKHFPGHGDTNVDSHKALPVLSFSRARLDSIELYPFKRAIEAGLGGVMVGHLQVPSLDFSGLPASLSPAVVDGLLRNEMGFRGLTFTDALAMKGVAGQQNLCVQALKAGNDMLLTPRIMKVELDAVMDAIERGELSEHLIEEKCRRVLIYKYVLGASRKKMINLSGLEQRINTPDACELINRLREAAITVVGNQRNTLPFHFSADTLNVISIGGLHADTAFVNRLSLYVPVKVHRLTEQTSSYVKQQLLDRIANDRRVVISVTTKKVKTFGPFLASASLHAPVVYALFVPYTTMEPLPSSLKSAAAWVVAHSSEVSVQQRVAEVLFGRVLADGRLSARLFSLYPVGAGRTIEPDSPSYYEPEELDMDGKILERIDTLAEMGIRKGAYPGCQIYVLRRGKVLYDKTFGAFTYEKDAHKVQRNDLYDLASLTKTTATLLAVMKLYDRGEFNLSDKISVYLPYLKGTDKEDITIQELLLHESGLPAGLFFAEAAIDKESYKGTLFKNKRDAEHTVQIGKHVFARSNFSFKPEWVSATQQGLFTVPVADKMWINRNYKGELERILAEAKMRTKIYRYGCPNFILLKEMVEHIIGEGMDVFLQREFYQPMQLRHLLFNPLRVYAKTQIAPTAQNDYLRRASHPLQGYVHDESAAFFGGVSGNAGLFGSAADVAAVYQMLLNGGMYKGKRYLSETVCRVFSTTCSRISRRVLGFDRPNLEEPKKSPCAESAPVSVYGHTGFTGTCAWVDPENELVYVFLCNRIYPNPWNNLLGELNIRTDIQEVLYKARIKER